MTICLRHEQPISFRACRLAHADKMKLSVILNNLAKKDVIKENFFIRDPIILVWKKGW